ncbi:hypothetical protein AOQ84DRAFT_122654 [Glonium stellatum]|uniref:Uncharacterized protein n=1 Tax=Glonium stellatum TaxID=574774 RepID=A0A8E2FAQ8_9PEZI|nr:hypothetical protein AOQ84DRAFT_122654 [Glonium stellatum]
MVYDRMLYDNPAGNSLANTCDKLPTISGLASQYRCSELGDYLAGTWSKHLLSMLLWTKASDWPARRRRPSSYIAPSWSWASLVGPVIWNLEGPHSLSDPGNYVAEIIEAKCETSPDDEFGSVYSGYLIISSPYMFLGVRIESGRRPTVDHESISSCLLDSDPVNGRYEVENGEEVTCLFLRKLRGFSYQGILIKPVDSTCTSYVRVGSVLVVRGRFNQLPKLLLGKIRII